MSKGDCFGVAFICMTVMVIMLVIGFVVKTQSATDRVSIEHGLRRVQVTGWVKD